MKIIMYTNVGGPVSAAPIAAAKYPDSTSQGVNPATHPKMIRFAISAEFSAIGFLFLLVSLEGFEPPAFGFVDRRSIR